MRRRALLAVVSGACRTWLKYMSRAVYASSTASRVDSCARCWSRRGLRRRPAGHHRAPARARPDPADPRPRAAHRELHVRRAGAARWRPHRGARRYGEVAPRRPHAAGDRSASSVINLSTESGEAQPRKGEITAYRANVSVDLRLDQGVSGANTTGSRAYAPRRKVMGLAF